MNLDEWVDLLKNAVGSSSFKAIAVAFLRERFGLQVQYSDGPGDGGVDAWIVLQSYPLARVAAQFHAGKAESWDRKLADDLAVFCAHRDALVENDPARRDFGHLYFVCTQTPSATSIVRVARQLRERYQVAVEVFDARAIASLALQNKRELWRLLAQFLPRYEVDSQPLADPREEALLAFSFFHADARKFRREVAKSAIATVLHRHQGARDLPALFEECERLLQLSPPSRLLRYALRDLAGEGLVELNAATARSTLALTETTRAELSVAAAAKESLREACLQAVRPLLSADKRHQGERARRAVDAVLGDLGALVQYPIAEEVLLAVAPSEASRPRYEREALQRWRVTAERISAELGAEAGEPALRALVATIARDPFAKRLAAAELFVRLTEHDAPELERALGGVSPQVLLDTTVALPMVCALFDQPVQDWKTSVAAYELYRVLHARGGRLAVASVHLEEIASHLLRARTFVEAIELDFDLSRSQNFFVAHYCALRPGGRTRVEFLEFLQDFGAPSDEGPPWENARRWVEQQIRTLLSRYAIEVVEVADAPIDYVLPNEPRREEIVLRHDRAVVYALQRWSERGDSRLVCSADLWLRAVLNERSILALDSVGLVDLMELVRPTDESRALLSPLELASSLHEEALQASAAVWDTIVRLEQENLRDREVVRKAKEFRRLWLVERRGTDLDLDVAWRRFRATGAVG